MVNQRKEPGSDSLLTFTSNVPILIHHGTLDDSFDGIFKSIQPAFSFIYIHSLETRNAFMLGNFKLILSPEIYVNGALVNQTTYENSSY